MTPTDFPQSNTTFGPPTDMDQNQCKPVRAHISRVLGGSVDGAIVVVVAWQPSEQDIVRINSGAPVYLSMMGGLYPHFMTTEFEQAVNPA